MPRSVLILFLIAFLWSCPDVSSAQIQKPKRDDSRPTSKTLDHLIESLNAEDTGVRRRAVENLRSRGDSALPALPALIGALEDDSISIRIETAKALGAFGPAAKDALPKLAALLDDEEVRLVEPVTMSIGFIGGPDNKSVVRRLLMTR